MRDCRIAKTRFFRSWILFTLLGVLFGTAVFAEGSHARVDRYLLLTHEDLGVYETLDVSYEKSEALKLTIRLVKRTVHSGFPAADLLPIEGSPEDFHWHLIEPDLEFGLKKYERRNWGEFREKLREKAKKFLNDYISISIFNETDQRIGSIRFIHRPFRQKRTAEGFEVLNAEDERYGPAQGVRKAIDLPVPGELPKPPSALMEADYLGIELPMRFAHEQILDQEGHIIGYIDSSVESETGNFAVDEEQPFPVRSAVLSELWIQFMRYSFSSWKQSWMGSANHAYANRESLKMYLPMGYDYLRRYKINGVWVEYSPEEIPPPITKDGIDWWPIVFYPEKMLDFNDRVSGRGFRGFNPQRIRARRLEKKSQPQPEIDHQMGLPNLLANLANPNERIATTAIDAMVRLFEANQYMNENWIKSCPSLDYGSDLKNDPLMFSYETYCRMLTPLHEMQRTLQSVLLPRIQDLASDPAQPLRQERAQRLLKRLKKIRWLQFESRTYHELLSTFEVDAWNGRFLEIKTQASKLRDSRHELSPALSTVLRQAVEEMVLALKGQEATAIVLSGKSAILSYSLLRTAWPHVGADRKLPPFFLVPQDVSDTLTGSERLPATSQVRILVDRHIPGLALYSGNVFVLDDHAYTGIKFVRQQDFFYRAGLLDVFFGFLAIHPDSLVSENTIGLRSLLLTEKFRNIGETLRSDTKAADLEIAILVKDLESFYSRQRGAVTSEPMAGCTEKLGLNE